MGAVIDDRAFAKHKAVIDRAHATAGLDIVAGGTYDDSEGWFVRPTIIESNDPTDRIFTEEYFGPILSVHVYPDGQFRKVMAQMGRPRPMRSPGRSSPGPRGHRRGDAGTALRGRQLLHQRQADRCGGGAATLRGGRASGTNDKAGAPQNLLRWTSPRSIKGDLHCRRRSRLPHAGVSKRPEGVPRGRGAPAVMIDED